MESIACVLIVLLIFACWLPLFLIYSGPRNAIYEMRNIEFLRKVFRTPRSRLLQKTG